MTLSTAGWPATRSSNAGRTSQSISAAGYRRRSLCTTGMLCTTSPSAENLISRILLYSAVAAKLKPGIGSGPGTAEQFALDDAANGVRGDDMDLLRHCGLLARHAEDAIATFAHLVRVGAGEADGDETHLARRLERHEHVGGTSRGRDGQKHVAGPAEPAHLTLERLLEAVIVADRGEHRGIGCECNRRQRLPIQQIAREKFGSDVLGVGRTAAVAGDEQLTAVAVGIDDGGGDLADGGQECAIGDRALERIA